VNVQLVFEILQAGPQRLPRVTGVLRRQVLVRELAQAARVSSHRLAHEPIFITKPYRLTV